MKTKLSVARGGKVFWLLIGKPEMTDLRELKALSCLWKRSVGAKPR